MRRTKETSVTSVLSQPELLACIIANHFHRYEAFRLRCVNKAFASCIDYLAASVPNLAGSVSSPWRSRCLVALARDTRVVDLTDLVLPLRLTSPDTASGSGLTQCRSVQLSVRLRGRKRRSSSAWLTSLALNKLNHTLYVCDYEAQGLTLLSATSLGKRSRLQQVQEDPEGVVATATHVYSSYGALACCCLATGAVLCNKELPESVLGGEPITWALKQGPDGALYATADRPYEDRAGQGGQRVCVACSTVFEVLLVADTVLRRPCGLDWGPSCGSLFVTSMDACLLRFAGPSHPSPGSLLAVIQLAEPPTAGAVTALPPGMLPWDVAVVRGSTLLVTLHRHKNKAIPKPCRRLGSRGQHSLPAAEAGYVAVLPELGTAGHMRVSLEWRPLELCYWPDQGALPAKGKEYPGLGYKRVRDKPPKAQEQQQQPAMAHGAMHAERYVKLYAKAARAMLGWSGEEAQLFTKLTCGYSLYTDSPELQAAHLDKAHVNDLMEEAAKHRRLLALEEGDSLQDTVSLPCRMRHAVHVCRCLEQWQQPPTTPVPGKPKRGGRRVGPRVLTCPPPFTLTPLARAGVHFVKVDSRVLHGVCKQLGLTRETVKAFTAEPARSNHWDRWFSTGKLANQGFKFERTVETDGVSVCVHYTRPLPPPPAPPSAAGPSSSNSSPAAAPGAAAVAAHEVGLPRIGKGLAEQREFVFNPDTQIGVGIDPGVTQAVSAASGVWDPMTGQLHADQLRRWKLTKGEVKHGSGLNNARRDTERWLAPIKPHLQHLAAASPAGTSLEANLKHITVTLATWDAVWEVYLDPKWAEQRLRLYGAQDRTLEQFFKKLEEGMAEVSMERHGHAKQLVVFFGAAGIGTRGGWGADAVLRACCKVVCRTRGTDQRRGRVVLVDEHRTSRVSSAVNGQQPCERQLNKRRATRPAGWKPPAGQVEPRLLRPAWSQQRDQPVRGMMWCPVVPPRKPPQAPRSSQAATQPAASEPGPSTPLPAKRSKRTKAEPEVAEPTKGKGKAAKAKPAPQPGRWLDRDCNAALNMQRIGESRWRPLELCYWPEQGKLPAKGKEYPGLGYKRVRDKPPKAQQQQHFAHALAKIFGIGSATGLEIAEACGISRNLRVRDIKEPHLQRVSQYIQDHFVVEDQLKRGIRENILRLMNIKCRRGTRDSPAGAALYKLYGGD
ncbi:hypothetical protein QJQ45_015479 [Haematococcus lacustris]|nr:hypothetical protein QJQ45_015479 [Haematococcus lacustris]